ncbi:MAG: ABC transporter permease [Treponema sp.]|jgi:simple sugar transport system permease protein|nr:ABC transporter permease [Treponema sp.]
MAKRNDNLEKREKRIEDKPRVYENIQERTDSSGERVILIKKLVKSNLIIPFFGLLLIFLFNLITNPGFFRVVTTVNNAGNTVLSGNIISILDNASELAILALGMTLVTAASGGQDISVGAGIAIAGGVMLRVLCGDQVAPELMQAPIVAALLAGCIVAMLFGAFNGALVSIFKIQPMVATLILYTAGRYIAYWINGGVLPIVSEPQFKYFGNFIPGVPVPTPVFITTVCMIIMALALKFTNLGLYTQAVGINERSARLNGINPVFIKFLAYVIMGLCVAVSAFIKVSRNATINHTTIAADIEMDAILAVAIGGNALGGGKFSMSGSVIGAYTIQALMTTLYAAGVGSDSLKAFKAIVIVIIVVVSSPVVKNMFSKIVSDCTASTTSAATKENR